MPKHACEKVDCDLEATVLTHRGTGKPWRMGLQYIQCANEHWTWLDPIALRERDDSEDRRKKQKLREASAPAPFPLTLAAQHDVFFRANFLPAATNLASKVIHLDPTDVVAKFIEGNAIVGEPGASYITFLRGLLAEEATLGDADALQEVLRQHLMNLFDKCEKGKMSADNSFRESVQRLQQDCSVKSVLQFIQSFNGCLCFDVPLEALDTSRARVILNLCLELLSGTDSNYLESHIHRNARALFASIQQIPKHHLSAAIPNHATEHVPPATREAPESVTQRMGEELLAYNPGKRLPQSTIALFASFLPSIDAIFVMDNPLPVLQASISQSPPSADPRAPLLVGWTMKMIIRIGEPSRQHLTAIMLNLAAEIVALAVPTIPVIERFHQEMQGVCSRQGPPSSTYDGGPVLRLSTVMIDSGHYQPIYSVRDQAAVFPGGWEEDGGYKPESETPGMLEAKELVRRATNTANSEHQPWLSSTPLYEEAALFHKTLLRYVGCYRDQIITAEIMSHFFVNLLPFNECAWDRLFWMLGCPSHLVWRTAASSIDAWLALWRGDKSLTEDSEGPLIYAIILLSPATVEHVALISNAIDLGESDVFEFASELSADGMTVRAMYAGFVGSTVRQSYSRRVGGISGRLKTLSEENPAIKLQFQPLRQFRNANEALQAESIAIASRSGRSLNGTLGRGFGGTHEPQMRSRAAIASLSSTGGREGSVEGGLYIVLGKHKEPLRAMDQFVFMANPKTARYIQLGLWSRQILAAQLQSSVRILGRDVTGLETLAPVDEQVRLVPVPARGYLIRTGVDWYLSCLPWIVTERGVDAGMMGVPLQLPHRLEHPSLALAIPYLVYSDGGYLSLWDPEGHVSLGRLRFSPILRHILQTDFWRRGLLPLAEVLKSA